MGDQVGSPFHKSLCVCQENMLTGRETGMQHSNGKSQQLPWENFKDIRGSFGIRSWTMIIKNPFLYYDAPKISYEETF